ncbi:MAG: restriction endonuclease subunit S [Pseudomonas sp.]|uniref:restriction endonuclease subunit S n=1 Tax=Pseudomonas sp. TaxID=306 RepID=UPI00398194A3
MSELPSGWVVCQLSDIGHIVTGKTPSTKEPRFYGGEIPFIKPGDLDHSGPVISTEVYLTDDGLAEVPALPPDSIVVTCIGNLGKVGITTKLSASNQQINAVVPDQGVDPTYIFHYCKTLKPWLESESSATTISIVNKGIFSTAPIPLPPLAEQTRIAQKLDELLAQVDTLKARIDAIPALLKRFRQSVLAAAVSGRLTGGWRAQIGIGLSVECSEDFAWPAVRLGEVARDFSYGSSAKSQPTGNIPVLRMGNIQGGRLVWDDLVFSSDQKEIEKYALKSGDVLFNRTNSPELVGKTAIYKGEQPAIYAGYLIRIRCSEHLSPDFLNYCLNSPQGRDYCWQVKTDGVSQSNINAKKLADFRLGLPSIEEQTEIVRRVEQLFAFADQLEVKVASAKSRIDHLTQSILAKAFRGELVPQDPNDEPASVLLERIQAQRAAAPKAKRGRKSA